MGKIKPFNSGTFSIFRTKFQPYAAQRRDGGLITFQAIAGKAEVWLDNVKAGEKTCFATGPLLIALPPGNDKHALRVLIESDAARPAGLAAPVTVGSKP